MIWSGPITLVVELCKRYVMFYACCLVDSLSIAHTIYMLFICGYETAVCIWVVSTKRNQATTDLGEA